MTTTIFSSREFNQDASGAKAASLRGPVIITDRGRPAHVLLSIEAYKQLAGQKESIAELLAAPNVADIDLSLAKNRELARVAQLG